MGLVEEIDTVTKIDTKIEKTVIYMVERIPFILVTSPNVGCKCLKFIIH
jgi:hypothetical protein